MDIIQALKEELQIGRNQVEAAVKLIDEGNTIPFIARYRKEATGSLNERCCASWMSDCAIFGIWRIKRSR